jgi:hypothetical protein
MSSQFAVSSPIVDWKWLATVDTPLLPANILTRWQLSHLTHLHRKQKTPHCLTMANSSSVVAFFVIPFYLQSVLIHLANCVKNVYNGM